MNTDVRPEWASSKRLVVKIGSSLLIDAATGALNRPWLMSLIDDIADLRAAGREIVLVSSGAVGLGRGVLGLTDQPLALEQSQAAAAVGQIRLAHDYQDAAARHGIHVAQVLVTIQDTEQRRRYLNARQTIETLLQLKTLPVVNENDTVATNEIRYGDNDRLSARVASMVSADCLVILSDIDGLYTEPPTANPAARRLDVIHDITSDIEAMAGDAGSALAKGGMRTKLAAAKVAQAGGCHMVLASGLRDNPLRAIANGGPCTWFIAPSDPVTAKKRWLSGQLDPLGEFTIDAGAERALLDGKSLLPAGVVHIRGTFERGDPVVVRDEAGDEIARGLTAYGSDDALRIIGKQSSQIAELLGFEGRSELVHRDDLALMRSGKT
ncbi:MAG: glutamate 5-kinase [Pseudomonadota bacterium]